MSVFISVSFWGGTKLTIFFEHFFYGGGTFFTFFLRGTLFCPFFLKGAQVWPVFCHIFNNPPPDRQFYYVFDPPCPGRGGISDSITKLTPPVNFRNPPPVNFVPPRRGGYIPSYRVENFIPSPGYTPPKFRLRRTKNADILRVLTR